MKGVNWIFFILIEYVGPSVYARNTVIVQIPKLWLCSFSGKREKKWPRAHLTSYRLGLSFVVRQLFSFIPASPQESPRVKRVSLEPAVVVLCRVVFSVWSWMSCTALVVNGSFARFQEKSLSTRDPRPWNSRFSSSGRRRKRSLYSVQGGGE